MSKKCGKVSYSTSLEAYMALETIRQRGPIKDSTPVRHYKCPLCGKHHLTSKKYVKRTV